MLQDQILLTCKRHLKLIKKILQHFCSILRAPTALVIGVCLSRTPKLFAKDSFLSLDFATNTLINWINSFYFYAIKRIMQQADMQLTEQFFRKR